MAIVKTIMTHTNAKNQDHYVMHGWQESRSLWHSDTAIVKVITSYAYRKCIKNIMCMLIWKMNISFIMFDYFRFMLLEVLYK